ncbi:L,D-transpeptidase/peptidoglycan binding protein [Solirubrobacter ginsenosidimutans]|uniref:L,D-transpeptidase/peptidoglycan binding protein n=1 Tax=Solirubrobacter ginsenosidimutans TaxID=490573 RepID=A0A9X3MV11_9ACTN|nr:L,D-transpeptidase/peptidoglycan binding protein [Solirubrobacter ginsenosidimutans]MDA0163219.1 L,D-transpeptidase/peptidoglycan binding protein [Solirubrobacter ginsenosidimutans]
MRRTVLAAFALFALLVPSANAAEPRIAAGVTAAGTDVSGLTLAEAAGKLYNTFGFSVGRPLSTHAAGHKYAVNPSDLGFVYDVNKTARRAYNAGLKPHTQPVDVPLFVTYDAAKVTAYATKVAADLKRDPRDARVDIKLKSIGKVASKDGRAIDATALATSVGAALSDPAKDRILKPKVKVVRPKVTTAGLSKAYGTIITIDRGNFKLRLFKNLKVSKTYGVAVGMPAYPTPTGRFNIANKAVNPAWTAPNSPWAGAYANETVEGGSAENPLKARWMGIVNGVGIHGTGAPGSIGSRASHGCIRMTVPDVIDLYPRVPVGTPVLIGN